MTSIPGGFAGGMLPEDPIRRLQRIADGKKAAISMICISAEKEN
jgi:hypothetical protein